MNITTKATNIEITPEISNFLDTRLSALDKFVNMKDDNVIARVEIAKTTKHHKSGDIFKAEINLSAHGKDFYAVSEREDLNTAIDEVRDQMVHELSSWKGKKMSLMKRGGTKIKQMLKGFYKRQ